MDKNLNIINPEDKDYYDGKLYMVGLYPGAGAELKTFYVYGEYEGEALESVVAYLDLSSETGLLLDMDEVEDIVYDDYGEEYNNWLLEHPESDWFEFANEYLGYVYVDATMKGASQPYYVEGNYLRIEEVEEDKVEEDKEVITESDDEPVYYNILHGEDNKYTLLVKTSKRLKGKESDTDDTVLMQLIDALEDKELIDPDLAEDLEFGKLKIEWNSTANWLLEKGFTCYDLTKYKFKENKEVKTEDVKEYLRQRYKTPTTNYIAKCTLTNGDKKFKNEYLLLDTKDSNGMSGVDIILENNRFNILWYNCDYGVENLKIVAEVKTLDELIDFMKSVGVDLSGMVKDGEIEVGMSDRINQNLYRYVVDDEESDPKFFGESKEVKTEAYSKDELKELLNNGEILKVGQANFKFENGQVWFYDPSITFGWENKHPRLKTIDDLVNHLDKLQSNKYKINVVSKDAKEKSGEEMYDLLKATNVKNWYKDTFPQDELADEINDSITFYDVFNALDNHKDIYNLLGVGDSVVRERVFNALDDILDEPEGYSYEQWTLTEGKEIKIESVEPEENKKLDLKDRVKYAYENCNYSKRKDMPTVSDIMDYLGLDTYNNKLYNQISDILYELGYDWQLESKQIQSDKEIKTEDFKPATVEENPEIKNPHFWWEDKDTFIMEFDGGVDNEGDKYWYLVEYWADEDTYHFFKQYDYDTIVLNLPEDKKEQIINMMKAKMN